MIQPAVPMDAMQRLAFTMAMMILGAPQVYSCNTRTSLRTQGTTSLSDVEICPVVMPSEEAKMRFGEEPSDPGDWVRLLEVHYRQLSRSSHSYAARTATLER